MQSLMQLCEPRPSVFDRQPRDTVLDISDLVADRIDPVQFFEENYLFDTHEWRKESGICVQLCSLEKRSGECLRKVGELIIKKK